MVFVLLFRYLLGYVRFTVNGSFVERFINLCAKNHINIWHISKKNGVLSATMLIKDYKKLRSILAPTDLYTKISRRGGLPFVVERYKYRLGIVVGLALFIGIMMFFSSFIWNIKVVGNVRISESEILSVLSELGFKKGTLNKNLDITNIEQNLILKLPDLSWVSINISGSSADVEVLERRLPPDVTTDNPPCNIIAAKTGQIISMQVFDGQPVVKAGDAVEEGDLIVSGIIEDKKGNYQLKRASAVIIARTTIEKDFTVLLKEKVTEKTGKVVKRKYLNAFEEKFPLFIAKKLKGDYELIVYEKEIKIFGLILPVKILEYCYTEINTKEVNLTIETARERILEEIAKSEAENMKEINIINKELAENINETSLNVKVTYECEENIAILDEIELDR